MKPMAPKGQKVPQKKHRRQARYRKRVAAERAMLKRAVRRTARQREVTIDLEAPEHPPTFV